MNIALCDVRGARGAEVQKFLEHKLGLRVHTVTPEQHDREMAYVQGLTHLVGRIVAEMTVPDLHLTTRTYDYLAHMVEMIRHDSEELFYTIARENPFSTEVTDAFFNGAERLKERLEKRK